MLALKTEKGVMSQRMHVASGSWKVKEMDSLLELPEGRSPVDSLILDPFQTCELQSYKIINLCCF